MEKKVERQVRQAWAKFRVALGKTPRHREEDQIWSTQLRRDQQALAIVTGAPPEIYAQASVNRFKASGKTPQEVAKELCSIVEEYGQWYKEDQQAKKLRREEARKSLEFQKQPFYRICLGATYGIFGSFHGASGHSETGRKYGEEIKKMDTQTLKDAIRRLKNRELSGYPLQGYPNDFIEQIIQYLTTEIITREGN